MKNVLLDITPISNEICEICPLAKHKRFPFPFHNHVSKFPFDLIHCDIWCPYVVPTIAGHKYFLTIVNDCTRSTWVYLMKSKSKTRPLLQSFIPWLKLNLVNLLRSLGLIMGLNFKWLISLSLIASYINIAMLPLRNKTQLWRGNISIYFVLQEFWDFNQIFLLIIGVIADLLLCILSTDFLILFWIINLLLNFFTIKF